MENTIEPCKSGYFLLVNCGINIVLSTTDIKRNIQYQIEICITNY